MRIRSAMAHLMTVAFALLVAAPALTGQELEVAWENYLSADASLRSTLEREQKLQEQQNRLQTEIRDLRENRSWYNGWLVEYSLSRKSAQQLELADSLGMVKSRIHSQQQRKESSFQILKKVYADMLQADDAGESFSTSQREQAVTLGRWLIARSESQLDLPDYSAILTEQYESEAVRDMVFSDLQVVLHTKLASIDTILTEKRQEINLLNRLNEFHRDLSIQIETNRDLQGETETRSPFAAVPEDKLEEGSEPTFWDGLRPGDSRYNDVEDPSYAEGVRSGISQEDDRDISLNPDPLYDEVQRLTKISQQYQDLLQRLGTELPD